MEIKFSAATRPDSARRFFLLLLGLMTVATPVLAQTTTYTFSQPDGPIALPWSTMTGTVGNLYVQNQALTITTGGNGGIYRPLSFGGPVTFSANITQQNGFGGLQDRYVDTFDFKNNGSVGNGYGITFYRGDQNYYDSAVQLTRNGAIIASDPTSFQFGSSINTSVTVNPDGSVTGSVSEGSLSSPFSFAPDAAYSSLTGTQFGIELTSGDTRSAVVTDPTISNLNITYNTNELSNPPSTLILAELSKAAYLPAGQGAVGGFVDAPFDSPLLGPGIGGYAAHVFVNGNQVVIAFRGTTLDQGWQSFKEIAADGSFATQVPTAQLSEEVKLAAELTQFVAQNFPNAQITLTGWSLGGALAQIVGYASGYATTAFNAPKVGLSLYGQLSPDVVPALNLNGGINSGQPNVNYRNDGDIVSQIGPHFSIGTTVTLDSSVLTQLPTLTQALEGGLLGPITEAYGFLHDINVVIAQLQENPTETVGPVPSNIPPAILGPISAVASSAISVLFGIPSSSADEFIDPSPAASYTFIGNETSPDFQTLTLPLLQGVSAYDVRTDADGFWSPDVVISPLATYTFGQGVDGFQIFGLNANGNTIPIDDALVFDVTYTSSGEFQGTLSAPPVKTPEPSTGLIFGTILILFGSLSGWAKISTHHENEDCRYNKIDNDSTHHYARN